jgi:hypothetical protein
MAFMFENLHVYQKAVDFADQTATLTETFPGGYYFLVDQLNRAALSIATNLAEGNGRFSKADRKNFFIIARLRSGMRPVAGDRVAPRIRGSGQAHRNEVAPRRDRPNAGGTHQRDRSSRAIITHQG